MRFNSIAIHTKSQWEADRAMIVLVNRVKAKIAENGKKERINT